LVAWGNDYGGAVSNTPAGNDFSAVSAGGAHSVAIRETSLAVSGINIDIDPEDPETVQQGNTVIGNGTVTGTGNGAVEYYWMVRKPGGVFQMASSLLSTQMTNGTASIPSFSGFPTSDIGQHKTWIRIQEPNGPDDSLSNEEYYTVSAIGYVTRPVFAPVGGTYSEPQQITVTCATVGAEIRYTTNGVEPAKSDPIVVSGGTVSIGSSLTLKAKAWKAGYNPSPTQTQVYTIEPLSVRIEISTPYYSWFIGQPIDFAAIVEGQPQGELQYSWDLDGDGIKDDWYEQSGSTTYWSNRTYLIGVEVTDGASASTAWIYATIGLGPIGSEPVVKPAVDVISGSSRDVDGAEFSFDSQRKSNGLVVITHGIWGSARGDEGLWLREMAQAIESKLPTHNIPNICLWDWAEMADPGDFLGCPDTLEQPLDDIIRLIRPYGIVQGLVLADWIESHIESGDIDPSKPIQIIGHSAGGFVAGNCALQLPSRVSQVTMLDTPFPIESVFTDYPETGNGKVDRYISSPFGHLRFSLLPIPEDANHHTSTAPEATAPSNWVAAHSYAHDWYTDNTMMSDDHDGFYYSPWLANPFPGAGGAQTTGLQTLGGRKIRETGSSGDSTAVPITGFETFGNVSLSGDEYTLSEQSNAGIFQTLTVPSGAESIAFEYRFLSEGDGDFLSVHWGTERVLFVAPELQLNRDSYRGTTLEVSHLTGQTNQVVFKLNSRGSDNSRLALRSIQWVLPAAEACIRCDMNWDGFRSIIGDVPAFVNCVYFGNCPDWPQDRLLGVGDCNHDRILSIIGDGV
jgi:pimeloyl-ACP methyl ester carboxylesterase